MLKHFSSLSKSKTANAKIHIRFRVERRSRCKIDTRDFGAIRRRRLLAEFLQERSARQQANVGEETPSRDQEIKVENQVSLSDDLLFKIFILLSAESLFRSQFVCKKWFSLINSSIFIRCHSHQSETVLICQKLTLFESGNPAALLKSYFHFLDLNNGETNFIESSVVELVDIRASYDGLILATIGKSKSLILMNPLTRKHIVLPLSTEGDFVVESFGIAFCNEAKTYKIIHSFVGKSGRSGRDILSIYVTCANNAMKEDVASKMEMIGGFHMLIAMAMTLPLACAIIFDEVPPKDTWLIILFLFFGFVNMVFAVFCFLESNRKTRVALERSTILNMMEDKQISVPTSESHPPLLINNTADDLV